MAKQLSDGSPAGAVFGQSATDLIAFHGGTPCDQSAVGTAVSTSNPKAISAGYGFATTAQFTAMRAAINLILVCLKEKGLMASS